MLKKKYAEKARGPDLGNSLGLVMGGAKKKEDDFALPDLGSALSGLVIGGAENSIGGGSKTSKQSDLINKYKFNEKKYGK